MINVYDIGNDNYTGNGDAVLVPTEAKLKMIAGGNYDLSMTHPMDPDGKWAHLVAGAVLRVPVPEEEIENAFAGLEADVYKVTTATDLREGPSEPTTITYPAWSISADYAVGNKVSHNNKNYECTYYDETSAWAHIAPGVCNWWKEIARSTPGDAVLVSLPVDSELYFVEDVDSSWYKMSTYYGIVGYVKKDKVTYDRHLTPSETKPRFITDQLLRITNATVDTKNRTVSVTAQHVSYDLNGVIIKDISIAVASPGMALARIVDGFMIPYKGTIATNLSSDGHGTYTNDIKGKSGMYALLDPDKGIVSTFSAAFRRDNWDLFVMEKTDTDKGFQLRRQKNLLGVNWTRKSDSLINRVVPIAKHEGGEDLYLPEVWVDSPHISEYPVIRMEMLNVKGEVGKDKGTGDGSVWTEEELQEEMREKARERFTVDKVDQVITEVTVDFEMLGATAEYPEMKALESVLLYDKVTVIDETIGLDTQLTVTELEWDALKKKVTAIKISNAEDRGGRSVTGYNVQAKSIGNDKLSDEVVNGIMKQVQDIIPEYADPEATRPATVEVIDGNPTLSWGNRSIVGTVQGTAMHVTMPADPGFNPNDLSEAATDPTDNDYTMEIGSTSYKLKFSRVWNYIKGKISSVLGLTVSAYGGKAATAGDADTVNGKTVGTNVPANAVFTDTWNANSKTVAGYVSAPGAVANKVWKTDGSGNPGWRDDADTPYTLPLAANGTRGGVQVGYTQSGKNYPVQLSSEKMYVYVPWTADGGNAATVNGKTVGTNVPANAVFTDTWRPVVDNLTSTDTDKSLSANQGKVLNDGKVAKAGDTMTGTLHLNQNLELDGSLKAQARFYPLIKSCSRSQWYKITFPFGTNTVAARAWFMLSFDLHTGGSYGDHPNGVIHIKFYWYHNENVVWDVPGVGGMATGENMQSIKLYYRTAEPGVLYVNNTINMYNTIWIDNLVCDDSSANYDFANTTMVTTSAITVSNYTELTFAKVTGVINNLTSTSTTDALSANQGKYINDRAMMGRSLLANGTDLNTITTVGMYGMSSSYSYTHAPSNMYMLMVGRYAPTSNSIYQLGFALAGILHYRLYDGSSWSSWYKFVGQAE